MNLKIELLKALCFILIGAWLGVRFMPEPKLPEVSVVQQQAAKCKAVVKKETKPDGSKSEEISFESDAVQKQEVLILPKSSPYELFAGIGTDRKFQVSVKKDNQLHELKSDGNKNHVYYFSYKVLDINL
jgi:hypothetical protein